MSPWSQPPLFNLCFSGRYRRVCWARPLTVGAGRSTGGEGSYLGAAGSGAPPGPECAAPPGEAAVRWGRRRCPGARPPRPPAPGRARHSDACRSQPWLSLGDGRGRAVRPKGTWVLRMHRHQTRALTGPPHIHATPPSANPGTTHHPGACSQYTHRPVSVYKLPPSTH